MQHLWFLVEWNKWQAWIKKELFQTGKTFHKVQVVILEEVGIPGKELWFYIIFLRYYVLWTRWNIHYNGTMIFTSEVPHFYWRLTKFVCVAHLPYARKIYPQSISMYFIFVFKLSAFLWSLAVFLWCWAVYFRERFFFERG